MSELLVIGHKNPDTDAICSAIGYAEFKRRTGSPHAEAVRCGDTNDRIDFVLRTFGVPAPRFIADVTPKVRDVMRTDVVSVQSHTTTAEAMALMDARHVRVLPVLGDDGVCTGLLSLFKLSRFLFPASNRPFDSRRVLSSIRNLAATLGGQLAVEHNPDCEEDLTLMIGAMSLESFAGRLESTPRERLVVVVGDRWDIQNIAIREGVRALIVTGGLGVEAKTVEAARRNRVNLVLSPHDTATTAALSRASVAVRHVVHEQFLSLPADAPLAEAAVLAGASDFQAFPVVDNHGKMVGILSKSDFIKRVDRKLILVDHNELSQAVQGAESVEIVEVIDHHRLGILSTAHPILFRNEPVGSTSTIVADCFLHNGVELPVPIAGLLLAGLVSDTLNLTSPTTTQRDRDALARLERISGVEASGFTEKLFASGSVLVSRTTAEAIKTDCKEYREGGFLFSVAQIEETGFETFHKKKHEVASALEDYRASRNYHFSALLVTDVSCQDSLLLVAGDPSFISKIDYPVIEPGMYELHSVVSRKKQLLPYLTHCLQRPKLQGITTTTTATLQSSAVK